MFENIKNKFLDKTIYFSFDKTGFNRHSKTFESIDYSNLKGRQAIVTGGSSGIGKSVVEFLVNGGASVEVLSRSKRDIVESHKLHHTSVDMSELSMLLNISKNLPATDFLVLNAGGMPTSLILNKEGIEFQFASQVLGHYVLFRSLLDNKKLHEQSKVIWTSSGGMYLCKYDKRMIHGKKGAYDKVATYANAKRAQVILSSFLAVAVKWLTYLHQPRIPNILER